MRRLLALVAVVLVLAGCSSTTTVGVADGSATVGKGEQLRVDLGEVNSSIGDSWHLVEKPDPAVLSEGTTEFDSECDEPGCGGTLSYVFTARAPGTTTMTFRYCYRSRPDDCEAQPDRGPTEPVKLTVTVT